MTHIVLAALIAWLSLAGLPAVATQDRPSADPEPVVISGTVTEADKGTYQEHAFVVPPGVTRMDVEFTHQHRGDGTQLEVGLFDTERFRGTSRFSKERFHLGEVEATPSYTPGAIVAGTWRLSLGIPVVRAGGGSTWRATIRMSTRRTPREGLGPVLRTEAGWYVGDLHAHTLHSDAFGCMEPGTTVARGCQPWEVVEAARARGLDFVAITDHNTTTHHADLATLQESLTSMVLLRGQELTTFHGHANIYGTSRVIDFRLGFRQRSIIDVLDDVRREGALLSVNHPGRDTGDRCTGCGWDAPGTPWERIEVMEAVNGDVIEGRTAGMPFWYARLNEGHRITGVGGSDDHAARSPQGRVGAPATVVFATELSEAALLDGIRAGRVHVRTRGPEGPSVDMTATAGEQTVAMGSVMPATPSTGRTRSVQLLLRVDNAAGQRVEVVRSGVVVETIPIETPAASLPCSLQVTAGQWVHVRVRDVNGLTAFGNPIYF
jgi:hypothetical protein